MSRLTPAGRSLRASIAVNTSWANTKNRSERSAPGRQAFMDSFEAKVDPDGVMDEVTRKKAAENARKAHFQRMALKSVQARRAKKAG